MSEPEQTPFPDAVYLRRPSMRVVEPRTVITAIVASGTRIEEHENLPLGARAWPLYAEDLEYACYLVLGADWKAHRADLRVEVWTRAAGVRLAFRFAGDDKPWDEVPFEEGAR